MFHARVHSGRLFLARLDVFGPMEEEWSALLALNVSRDGHWLAAPLCARTFRQGTRREWPGALENRSGGFDAVIAMILGGEILSWSRAVERIFGEPHEASIGQSVAPRFREKSTRHRKSDLIDPRARATLIGMDNV